MNSLVFAFAFLHLTAFRNGSMVFLFASTFQNLNLFVYAFDVLFKILIFSLRVTSLHQTAFCTFPVTSVNFYWISH